MADEYQYSEYDKREARRESKYGHSYKWIALSNTTLGVMMATIDSSILIISLPAIFNGLGINPLTPGNITLLLWLLLGYIIMSSTVVITIGRLSDMFGRVRLYNLGFAIFAIGSTLLYVASYAFKGTTAVEMFIILRLVQGLGGGFLFANSTAIITDAFPKNQRGTAMGINQISAIMGSLLGLIIGGVLATIDWHLIFLISVPVGIIGAIWSYVALHEIAEIRKDQKIDIFGNITFALGLTVILLSMTYGLLPYGNANTGWHNPYVVGGMALGVSLIIAFIIIELKSKDPMFNLGLFKIKEFSSGIVSLFLSGIARGGLQFMLIIWLQGIWLPLHGVNFINTPLQAGIDMTPLLAGFLLFGPTSGYLSDRYGARRLKIIGMTINVFGFLMLAILPVNFAYADFAVIIFLLGAGQGMFAAPNTISIMNSVPPQNRGATSGIQGTLTNASFMFSMVVFFTILIFGLGATLPKVLYNGLIMQNVPNQTAATVSKLPPTSALFAALLGYNPMQTLLSNATSSIPKANLTVITGTKFFPSLISNSFKSGMRIVMFVAAAMAAIVAIISALRKETKIKEAGAQ